MSEKYYYLGICISRLKHFILGTWALKFLRILKCKQINSVNKSVKTIVL